MLEKIGLPPKPSQRGNNWVVDASHCQGCSSQFTFINRKHHCRRCGGLFCNSCTSQRVVLRGQGDSPVRICEPCKQLEDAARFEMRYGNRGRAGKASSTKSTVKPENEILSEISGVDRKESLASAGVWSSSKTVLSIERATSLNDQQGVGADGGEKVDRSASIDESSPEDMRRQAVEEKKKYKVLKGEGKNDEALRAFKRGKELERQADALEISLRRSRRKALSVPPIVDEVQIKEDTGGSRRGKKSARLDGKEKKDDLVAELRDLGWSDMDLHDEDDKKGSHTTLEGEFSSLLGEISEKTKKDKGINRIDRSQVLDHKKKALALKREGNLAEAKEELKKAKVLEKELEEQELLAADEDSDDEFSALIRSMQSDKQDLSSNLYEQENDFDLSSLIGSADRIIDGDLDVTNEDMDDPEILASLKSFGWIDDSETHESGVSVDKEALSNEILSLKREALTQKRAGNVSEAMSLLKKAKVLEKDLESPDSSPQVITKSVSVESKPGPRKSKLMIQKELIGLKKKALALKREGKLDEAEEELKKGHVLERQLEEMDKAPSSVTKSPNLANDNLSEGDEESEDVTDQDMNDPAYLSILKNLGWQEEQNDHRPDASAESSDRKGMALAVRPRRTKAELQRELLGLRRKALALRRQGESDEAEEISRQAKDIEAQIAELEQPIKEAQLKEDDPKIVTEKDMDGTAMGSIPKNMGPDSEEQEAVATVKKSKGEIQRELLNLKRKAFALRRKGETEEAEEILNSAKVLEAQLEAQIAELEQPIKEAQLKEDNPKIVTEKEMDGTAMGSIPKNRGPDSEEQEAVAAVKKSRGEIQRELLNLKRKAFALRRKGETEEAEEVLNSAKVLEAQLEELDAPKPVHLESDIKDEKRPSEESGSTSAQEEERGNVIYDTRTSLSSNSKFGEPENLIALSPEKQENTALGVNPTEEQSSQTNEADLKRDILAHKRKAVALKREGKLAEALEELRQAKFLEKQLVSQDEAESAIAQTEPIVPVPKASPPPGVPPKQQLSSRNRFKLQQESLAHKRTAMKLRREGRTEEADTEFELAKSIESRLDESSSSHDPNSVTGGAQAEGNLGVEDFLDPQLLSALRAIGIATEVGAPEAPQASKPNVDDKSESSNQERLRLEEQIKAEKVKALSLKRVGKQAEALDALRKAKLLEKRLNSLS